MVQEGFLPIKAGESTKASDTYWWKVRRILTTNDGLKFQVESVALKIDDDRVVIDSFIQLVCRYCESHHPLSHSEDWLVFCVQCSARDPYFQEVIPSLHLRSSKHGSTSQPEVAQGLEAWFHKIPHYNPFKLILQVNEFTDLLFELSKDTEKQVFEFSKAKKVFT